VFVHLWLIPLVAVALLSVAWYCVQGRIASRLAASIIVALVALLLLVSLGYVVQVASLANAMRGPANDPDPIVVAWGCWLAIGVNVIVGAVAVNHLKPSAALPIASLSNAGSLR
jgi:hypothetical protein